jgi:hypothetical protein
MGGWFKADPFAIARFQPRVDLRVILAGLHACPNFMPHRCRNRGVAVMDRLALTLDAAEPLTSAWRSGLLRRIGKLLVGKRRGRFLAQQPMLAERKRSARPRTTSFQRPIDFEQRRDMFFPDIADMLIG